MANPTLTVTLVSGADTLTLHAPEPDIPVGVNVPGVVHRTAGGSLVKYQTGGSWFETTLSIPRLTNAGKNLLEAFFRTHWRDALVYTDELGNAFTAHFLDTQLDLRKVQRDLWTVSIRLQLSVVLK